MGGQGEAESEGPWAAVLGRQLLGLEAFLPLGSKGLGWALILEWASDSRQWEQSPAPPGQRLRSARGQARALDLMRGR